MSGKQAKILADRHVADLLFFAGTTRHVTRNRVIVLLSVKAGLRAAEIAQLTWDMVVDPTGEIAPSIELHNRAAKKGSGRLIPMHPALVDALQTLRRPAVVTGPIIRSERGGPMPAVSIVNWFAKAYRTLGLAG